MDGDNNASSNTRLEIQTLKSLAKKSVLESLVFDRVDSKTDLRLPKVLSNDIFSTKLNHMRDVGVLTNKIKELYGQEHPSLRILNILYPEYDHIVTKLSIEDLNHINEILKEINAKKISVQGIVFDKEYVSISDVMMALSEYVCEKLFISGVIQDRLAIENHERLQSLDVNNIHMHDDDIREILNNKAPGSVYISTWINQVIMDMLERGTIDAILENAKCLQEKLWELYTKGVSRDDLCEPGLGYQKELQTQLYKASLYHSEMRNIAFRHNPSWNKFFVTWLKDEEKLLQICDPKREVLSIQKLEEIFTAQSFLQGAFYKFESPLIHPVSCFEDAPELLSTKVIDKVISLAEDITSKKIKDPEGCLKNQCIEIFNVAVRSSNLSHQNRLSIERYISQMKMSVDMKHDDCHTGLRL